MVYSKSVDITDEETDDIRKVMRYVPPRNLNPIPDEEEIKQYFPYDFSYFKLTSGRVCIGLSTYLGKDYSNRYGNYIIYALVMDPAELTDYPAAFFGESFMKNSMTEEELNTESPVPPLPQLDIDEVGNLLTDDILSDFVSERAEETAWLISAALKARKEKIPIYINDTRENLVLWMAVLQKAYPLKVAENIYFATYLFDQEKFCANDKADRSLVLDVQGVRPDASGFSYQANTGNARYIVADMFSGVITDGIPVLPMATDLASDFSMGMEEIGGFGSFLEKIGFSDYSEELVYAYQHYKLQKYKMLTCESGELTSFLKFGGYHMSEDMNRESSVALIEASDSYMSSLSVEEVKLLFAYLYYYADFMSYSIHEKLFNLLMTMAEEGTPENQIAGVLDYIRENVSTSYKDLKDYFTSGDVQSQQQMVMQGNPDIGANLFITKFILRNYPGDNRYSRVEPLLMICIDNLATYKDAGWMVVLLMSESWHQPDIMFRLIGHLVSKAGVNPKSISADIGKWMNDNLSPEESQSILSALMNDPGTVPLGLSVAGMYINGAEDRSEAFWNFYRTQEGRIQGSVDIGNLLDSYVDNSLPVEEAVKMINRIAPELLANYRGLDNILSSIEALPIKRLEELPSGTLNKAADIAEKAGTVNRYQKIVSISHAEACIRCFDLDMGDQTRFRDLIGWYPIQLENMDKRDYKWFTDQYLPKLIDTLRGPSDLRELFRVFIASDERESFYKAYVDYLKKLYRGNSRLWKKMMLRTCIMMIDEGEDSGSLGDFEPYIFSYLRKLDDAILDDIEERSRAKAENGRNTDFFVRAQEKENLMDRVNSIFRKK